jgi:VIT1/CCC1 family predicted Fe2+/Mn2+ transporter
MFENWRDEKQSAYLYRVMAGRETDAVRRALFADLASEAESQASIWAEKLRAHGLSPPAFRPRLRVRIVARLVRLLGPRRMRGMLAALKVRGLSIYRAPAVPGHPMPTSVDQVGHRHRGVDAGGNLRAAVFGIDDGLVSNTSLILGVAGAAQNPKVVLLSGVAGLLAGAFSMAAGEYVSMRSQRELFEHQISLEREELALYPEEEAEELALIYNARGLAMEDARRVAHDLLQRPEQALDALAREELGLNPDELGSPWGAAASSFVAFAAGAVVPVLPFLWVTGSQAVPLSASLAGVALFGVGAALSLFTGRGAALSGLRMVLIGGAAGLATYLLGRLLGVTLA